MKTLHLLLALSLAASGASASTLDLLGSISRQGKKAGQEHSSADAKWQAGAGWDRMGTVAAGDEKIISPSLLPQPAGPSLKKPTADLIVGTPGAFQVKEPENPLTKDGKAKEQESGNKLWWALGGAAVGAGIGFLLFGPLGALIGGLAAGAAGYFFGP